MSGKCELFFVGLIHRTGDGMQLRFPVQIQAIVRELHKTHLFDTEGERIVGREGDGPRLKECRLRVAFEMQATKTYAPMPPPQPASIVLERNKRRLKEPVPPNEPSPIQHVAGDATLVRVPVERPGKRLSQRYVFN